MSAGSWWTLMKSDLLVVLPTRGRPGNLNRFIESFAATTELPSDLHIIADDDDHGVLNAMISSHAQMHVIPRASTAYKVNYAAVPGAKTHRAVMFLGDDNVFRTPGWDRRVIEELDIMGGGMIHVNDLGGQEAFIPCNIAISSSIVNALGYFDHPSMNHFFVDNVWMELGRGAGCIKYLPDVVIEHMHHIFGKAEFDQLYQETRQKWWSEDEAALATWHENGKAADIEKVRLAIHG